MAATVAAGALCCAPASGAEPEHARETFASQSRAPVIEAQTAYAPETSWVLHAGTASVDAHDFDGNGPRGERTDGTSPPETFADHEGERHSRDGGGWVEHGGFDDGHHECDDGCTTTTAVPEPARAALTVAGMLAVLVMVRRQRRGRHGVFAPR
jgi:hypothetical protein